MLALVSKAGKTFDGYYAAIVNYGLKRGRAKAPTENTRNVDYAAKRAPKSESGNTSSFYIREVQKITKARAYTSSVDNERRKSYILNPN